MWYDHYQTQGELLYDTAARYRRMRNKSGGDWKRSTKWTLKERRALTHLLKVHPEYYLDEFVEGIFYQSNLQPVLHTCSTMYWI
mmetsp:Transcript_28237/g.62021  ORF Transcript_28237/g.62021 Transcript_28237/m.62021 type:complete len:84 (+) Transcript_28237:249-500(+)